MEKLTKQINQHILKWSKDKNKLVVAIDGYTGIGKTTILNHLAKLNTRILPVHQDDFIYSRLKIKKLLKESEDRSEVFEFHNRDNKKIENLVNLFRNSNKFYRTKTFNPDTGEIDIEKSFDLSKKVLVIEGVFMFHPKILNHLWDKRIYLDGDMSVIDKRRIKREKEKWGKDYFPETHLDSYFKQVIIALKRYKEEYKPEQVADITLLM